MAARAWWRRVVSWWVSLADDDGIVQVERHDEGGVIVREGGSTDAELNVTFNYWPFFWLAWPEQLERSNELHEMLDERRARDTSPLLEHAIALLQTDRDDDYWARTTGSAGYALSILLRWARQHPDAFWEVS
jgi:hypothetical protein